MEMRYPRLKKRGSTYYCRVKVPASLRSIIGKREIVRSLETKDYAAAIRKLPAASAEANRMLDRARAQLHGEKTAAGVVLSPVRIAELLRIDRWQLLRQDADWRTIGIDPTVRREQVDKMETAARRMLARGLAPARQRASDGATKMESAALEESPFWTAVDEMNDQKAKSGPPTDDPDELFAGERGEDERAEFEQKAVELIEDAGLNPLEIDEASYLSFLDAFVTARVETATLLQARQRGEIVNTPPDPRGFGSPLGDTADDRLRTVYSKYAKAKSLPSTSTLEYDRAIRRFTDLFGDVAIKDIRRPMIRRFKECLSEMPAHLPNAYRDLSVPALLKKLKESPLEGPTLGAASVNKQIGAISATLTWARKNGYLDDEKDWQNPAFGIRMEADSDDGPIRLPMDRSDLEKVFQSPIFRGKRPKGGAGEAAYWLPVLALFTGARLEELGQLQTDDIQEHEGIPYISINTLDQRKKEARKARRTKKGQKPRPLIIDGEKRTKSEASKRPIPIHRELIRLGFLRYVEAMRKKKTVWLFPALKPDVKGKRTGNWSKWWGRWTEGFDLDYRDLKVFHSFRHSMKDALRDITEDEELRDDILGQNGRGGVGRDYGLGHVLVKRNEAIQRVNYPGLVIPEWREL